MQPRKLSLYLSFLLCLNFSGALLAASPGAGVTLPAPATTPPSDGSERDPNDNRGPGNDGYRYPSTGCSRSDAAAGNCRTYPDTRPVYRRPIIIQTTPAAVVDTTPTTDDWEGCRQTKINQLNLTRSGDLSRARQLDEWLWKNCRSYSEDLRQLEQDRM